MWAGVRPPGRRPKPAPLCSPPAMALATPHRSIVPPGQRSRRRALLVAARPRQWPKNLLVFAAPGAAGSLRHLGDLGRTAAVCALFIAASAGTYLLNDVLDAESDRRHPVKRLRPIAGGEISARSAVITSAALLVGSLAGASLLAGGQLLAVICTYVAITVAYSVGLKRVAVVELACVSSGFVLRAVAGAAAIHVPVSPWFLIVTSFSALMIVAGKRSAEIDVLGDQRAAHRATLGRYPPAFLRSTRVLAATVTVTSYCLWAFDRASHLAPEDRHGALLWLELSVIPFVLGVLVLELAMERGQGGAPEELALKDRTLQCLGGTWLLLLGIGIYS
jgi:decaprenyl-phosphate phosphoribosyltransferase